MSVITTENAMDHLFGFSGRKGWTALTANHEGRQNVGYQTSDDVWGGKIAVRQRADNRRYTTDEV